MRRLGFLIVLLWAVRSEAGDLWRLQAVGTESDFRGLCVVSPDVVWVSGTKGTFARTADGGRTWAASTVPGAGTLDFRDVEAFGVATAYLLSAGPGGDSRIYKTTDGGKTWSLQFTNTDPEGFYDALAFWDEKTGLAFGDPVKGRFQLLRTDNGGATWRPARADAVPPALPGEGAFAASGTCLTTYGPRDAWFVTGGAKVARVFRSADQGRTWSTADTPIQAGVATAGAFSIAFRDRGNGMIVGGDYRNPDAAGRTVAVTADGGKTWKPAGRSLPYRSAVAWAKDRWIAVGPGGTDVSTDDGATWLRWDGGAFNSVAFTPAGDGWAAGPSGRVAKLTR